MSTFDNRLCFGELCLLDPFILKFSMKFFDMAGLGDNNN